MTPEEIEEEKENFAACGYRMRNEGFHYCFEGYSNWEEIKDEEFHKLRLNYLKSAEKLEDYVNKKNQE